MAKTMGIAGVEPQELAWLRLLISLLRHPDRRVPESVHEALWEIAEGDYLASEEGAGG